MQNDEASTREIGLKKGISKAEDIIVPTIEVYKKFVLGSSSVPRCLVDTAYQA